MVNGQRLFYAREVAICAAKQQRDQQNHEAGRGYHPHLRNISLLTR
jgi:hypothetical protein